MIDHESLNDFLLNYTTEVSESSQIRYTLTTKSFNATFPIASTAKDRKGIRPLIDKTAQDEAFVHCQL